MFVINCIVACVVAFMLSLSTCSPIGKSKSNLTIISREEWGGYPPCSVQELETPVPFVVIHHSSVPEACFSQEECSAAMRIMQFMHQVLNEWVDIGYNFAVGSDGLVYEGRGWENVGAHTAGVNSQSIGIVLIGHWVSDLPPRAQLDATKQLIYEGIRQGRISAQYLLVGHRQVRPTECPGDALYEEIEQWGHFTNIVQFD